MGQPRLVRDRPHGGKLHKAKGLGVLGRGALIALALAGAATAQDLPAAYAVTGVAAGDVLNIRARPSAEAPVIGSYAPDRTRIEVLALSPDGRWGQVGLPEGMGWVAMRFLVAEAKDIALPRPFRCIGTEPFWGLTVGIDGARFVSPDGSWAMSVEVEARAADGFLAALEDRLGGEWTFIASQAQCSDGMSDRIYGWEGLVFRQTSAGNSLLLGCCTMDGG